MMVGANKHYRVNLRLTLSWGGFSLAVALLSGSATLSARTYYKAIPLAPLFNGGGANAINGSGQTAGERTEGGVTHALFYDGTVLRDIGGLGGTVSRAVALNDSGQIAGVAVTTSNASRAFRYSNNTLSELPVPTDTILSIASDINKDGVVAGWVQLSRETVGALWAGGFATAIPSLGGSTTHANAVNDVGDVVGFSFVVDFTPPHAFLYRNGQSTDLGVAGGIASSAADINNVGDVVGYIDYPGGIRHPMLYSAGQMRDLGTLGGPLSSAKAINDSGVIVGDSYTTSTGLVHGFIWSKGLMIDLNAVTDLEEAGLAVISDAFAINNRGDILCTANPKDPTQPSNTYLLTPVDADSRLVNFSIRAKVSEGEATLLAGFVIAGSPGKKILMRSVGPGLLHYGVANFAPDPRLTLFTGPTSIGSNDNWGSSSASPQLIDAFKAAGAFDLDDNSKDAAIAPTLVAGGYTMHTTSAVPSGVALAELYDADSNPNIQIRNFSARTAVGTNEETAIAGFVVAGTAPKTLLIRAIGPSLAAYGVNAYLSNPQLSVFSGNNVVASNDDWAAGPNRPTMVEAMKAAGAFELATTSKDAAVLVTLPPGSHTVHVTAADGGTGVVLIEIFEVL